MEGVIFDMDGVTVDSEPRHERAFLEVVKELGYEHSHGVHFPDYIGRSDRDLWKDFVARHQPSQTLEQLLEMKRERVLGILRKEQPLFEGLPELVQGLVARVPLGIASGSHRAIVDAVLEFRDLKRFFSAIVTGADVAHGKPAPDIFLRAAQLLNVAPSACWVIEDSKPGVAAAVAARMSVIAITNTHSAEELAGATHIVKTYSEIGEILMSKT